MICFGYWDQCDGFVIGFVAGQQEEEQCIDQDEEIQCCDQYVVCVGMQVGDEDIVYGFCQIVQLSGYGSLIVDQFFLEGQLFWQIVQVFFLDCCYLFLYLGCDKVGDFDGLFCDDFYDDCGWDDKSEYGVGDQKIGGNVLVFVQFVGELVLWFLQENGQYCGQEKCCQVILDYLEEDC